ncbi:MAG: hypothetical protein ACPL1Z_03035 [Candidatus Bathyarchaeales archaeon]
MGERRGTSLSLTFSHPLQSWRDYKVENMANKEFVEELKKEWKTLWRERIDDKVRAEAIANRNYNVLFVERGTVIFATKKFKLLSLREIMQMHGILDAERFVLPNPSVGGWGKFIRTVIVNQQFSKRKKRSQQCIESEKKRQQLKKGGRGWLHLV